MKTTNQSRRKPLRLKNLLTVDVYFEMKDKNSKDQNTD